MATPIPVNRCMFDVPDILNATDARFSGEPGLRINGVGIDSRNLLPGAAFVALRGVRDGHEFVASAAAAGAGAAIVERGRRHEALPCFEVDDTLGALGGLARYHLDRLRLMRPFPVVAIGGAAGKTTTKELVAALMRTLFGEILATPGNLNNLIGVPMTLLTLGDAHRAAVLECGTNQRGEIARLGGILKPDVALVLNVDIEHTEGLGSLEGVADEEAALFAHAHCAIVSISEPLLATRIPPGMRTITFGSAAGAEVRLASRRVIAPGRQQIELDLAPWMAQPPHLKATLNLLGAPSAENAAAAVAAAATAWSRPLERVQVVALGHALGSVPSVPGRLSTNERNGIVIIDDTYNANPRSVRAALAAARETANAVQGRLVVALGDMLELGQLSALMHADAVREVFAVRPERFIAVGPEFAAALGLLADSGVRQMVHIARDSGEAAAVLPEIVRPGDVLLVKGSRGIAMERVLDRLSAA